MRAYWMRTMIQWHWISSAISLVGMLLFAVTGITLNHPAELTVEPEVTSLSLEIPTDLQQSLAKLEIDGDAPLPADLSRWLGGQIGKSIGSRTAEWSEEEIYLSMQGPGSDAWLAIDRESGQIEYERTDRGWISYFNDLHKGRNTGAAWRWFIDVFAVATLIFCITGLMLLYFHARHRRMTWPLVTLGLILPLLLAMLFIH
ncbi:PepSY-associated TM helix domain-containing protein [Blastopirellula retiformator]|uniref:PepSY-associated TM helix domain-containing protein n=1 Tax=Blastopirellula retiformator TaxID=2527970 RepID=UPI0036F1C105